MMDINLYICIGFGLATLAFVIYGTIERFRTERRTVRDSLDAMDRIMEALSELPNLQGKERAAKRRMIAREILVDIRFVCSMLMEDYREGPDDDDEVRRRSQALLKEILQLQWDLRKSLFLFRFRPGLVADCRRTLHAALAHYRVWIAYLRLLKAKYPDLYGNIEEICDF